MNYCKFMSINDINVYFNTVRGGLIFVKFEKGDKYAIINLNSMKIRYNNGVEDKDLNQFLDIANSNKNLIMQEYSKVENYLERVMVADFSKFRLYFKIDEYADSWIKTFKKDNKVLPIPIYIFKNLPKDGIGGNRREMQNYTCNDSNPKAFIHANSYIEFDQRDVNKMQKDEIYLVLSFIQANKDILFNKWVELFNNKNI